MTKCKRCNGSGTATYHRADGLAIDYLCPDCKATKTMTNYDLRQMRTEPCEWCEGKQGKFFDVNWYDYAEHKRGEVRYCPNCGKELVK